MAGTSYQILEVKSFCDRGRAKPPIKITALIFQVKNSTMKFPGWIFFENKRKNLKLNLVIVVILVLKS